MGHVVRAGASPHRESQFVLAPSLLVALDEQAHRVTRSGDALQTIRIVGDLFDAMRDELARFSTMRLAAVSSLRAEGLSYDRIASSTGMSKARVAQLSLPPVPRH